MVQLQNFIIYDFPLVPGINQTVSIPTPTFSWGIGSGVPTLYDLQINYNSSDFSSPQIYVQNFQSTNQQYRLSPEYSLGKEGIYYTRISGYDGSWGSWSDTLQFNVVLFGPNPPTIDAVITPADGFWQIISGDKDAGLYVYISNNGMDWQETSYQSGLGGTRWYYNMPLVKGNNIIEVVSSQVNSLSGVVSEIVSTSIYLIVSTPTVYNVWNCFDEFGLILGLPRIPGEKNKEYKDRLLDVYKNPSNSTYEGMKRGISRELGLDYNSISVERLSDLLNPDYAGNLLNSDGNALGTPLEKYADEVYDHNPMFWGNVISDESYWDGVDQTTSGYTYLPHIWDPSASGIYPKWQTGGIGDQDDLWVKDPIKIWNSSINDYNWFLPIHTGFFYSANPSGIRGF